MGKNLKNKICFDYWASLQLKPGDIIQPNKKWWTTYDAVERSNYEGLRKQTNLILDQKSNAVDFCRWIFARWYINGKLEIFPFEFSNNFLIVDVIKNPKYDKHVTKTNNNKKLYIAVRKYKLLYGEKILTAFVMQPNFF